MVVMSCRECQRPFNKVPNQHTVRHRDLFSFIMIDDKHVDVLLFSEFDFFCFLPETNISLDSNKVSFIRTIDLCMLHKGETHFTCSVVNRDTKTTQGIEQMYPCHPSFPQLPRLLFLKQSARIVFRFICGCVY